MSEDFFTSDQILNQAFDEEANAIRISGDSAVENSTGGRATVQRITPNEDPNEKDIVTYKPFITKYSSRIRTMRVVR